jgi:glycosyltransferase involved in cell wall biosynthesis
MGIVPGGVSCLLLAPVPGNRYTGGHLVNDRLSRDSRVQLVHVTSLDEAAAILSGRTVAENDLPIVIDSLFLDDPEGVRILKGSGVAPVGLVAHSLPSLLAGAGIADRLTSLCREKETLALFDFAVAPSRFMMRALTRRGMNPSDVVQIAPAPIVDGRMSTHISRRPPNGVTGSDDTVRILTIANWSPFKGIDAAWSALKENADLPWEWQLIGQCDHSSFGRRLHADITTSALAGRVHVMESAPPEALQDTYHAADIFLLPSSMESYGLVFAEAISFGLPVVAVGAAAVPEVLGDCALLVSAGDDQALARNLRRVLTDPGERGRLSGRASDRAAGLPEWKQVCDRFVDATQWAAVQFGGTRQCG